MSKFFSEKFSSLTPYTPGEQPKERKYVKLNTNELPFAPHPSVLAAVQGEAGKLQLYSDPENSRLIEMAAKTWGVKKTQLVATNGSDEILQFAFMAFCDKDHPIVFPDISYGFYEVFAQLHGIPYEKIPLREDFSVDYRDYVGVGKNVVIANPNAPTGLCLSVAEVEEIVKSNPDNVVVIDEAYVDFGGESCVPLIDKYDNLLVTQTFSKSRGLAGARLGLGFACEALIADIQTIRYSTNPYNVNRMTEAAGVAALEESDYFVNNVKSIMETRAYVKETLESWGFTVLDSKTNFLFAKTDEIDGGELYLKLKERGVLVRHFTGERIKQFNRITIGSKEEMDIFLTAVKDILKEKKS
ncbi:MAG: histidinol-phosphate transaminase [Clostridiales bacterium]|nr:histidinol-phosphate transaminase [Clostridiales bacterium]